MIDKDDLTQRQQLIDVFVNAVYVYDDKLLITYNYKDGDKCISYEEIQEYMNKKENSDSLNDYQSSPLSLCGTPEGIRTPDLLVRSQTLYPTELRARVLF